jgi:hypothetical protein
MKNQQWFNKTIFYFLMILKESQEFHLQFETHNTIPRMRMHDLVWLIPSLCSL